MQLTSERDAVVARLATKATREDWMLIIEIQTAIKMLEEIKGLESR